MLQTIRDLFAHMEWADATVWRVALAHDDERLRALLHHLHLTQRAFLDVWTQRDFDFAELQRKRAGLDLMQWARRYYGELAEFVNTLTDASLGREIVMPWAARFIEKPAPVTLAEAMLQVASHSTYHRGQANMRLRELGAEPPLVDYIAWLWLHRPPVQWPENSSGG
jgi:uncharacterized damage-inducible protein DinB